MVFASQKPKRACQGGFAPIGSPKSTSRIFAMSLQSTRQAARAAPGTVAQGQPSQHVVPVPGSDASIGPSGSSPRNRGGRPRSVEPSRYLAVRLSVSTLDRLRADATAAGIRPSTLARRAIEGRVVVSSDSPLADALRRSLHTVSANLNQLAHHANRAGDHATIAELDSLRADWIELRAALARLLP